MTTKIKYILLLFFINILLFQDCFAQVSFATDTLHILPLGNSITFGQRSKDPRPTEEKVGYRYPLYKELNSIGFVYDFIGSEHSGSKYLPSGYDANGGFPGIKDNELANLLRTGKRVQPPNTNEQITPGPYLETYLPDLILLHIGTNGNQFSNGTSAEDIVDILNLVDSVENSSGKEIQVIVAKIINRVPNETFVDELNHNIDSMVTDRITNPANPSYPDKVTIVDMQKGAGIIYAIDSMGTIGDEIIGDMNDHYHPNDKGFLKMSNIWFDAIKTLFPKPFTITQQPQDFIADINTIATFSVHVNKTEPITFQWKKNGVPIQGETDSIYSTALLNVEDNAAKFNCEIRSKYYIENSDTATLYVFDSTSRVVKNLVAEYNFEENDGTIINNLVDKYSDLNLNINDTSGIMWVPYGLKIDSSAQILSQGAASDIYKEVNKTNEVTLDTWILPSNNVQSGFARIVTISKDTLNRNITLGQEANKFEVRLRTSLTDDNGKPSLFSIEHKIKDSLTHIVYTREENGLANLFVNGKLDTTFNIPGDFSNWDSTYSLSIGDEITGSRFWKGRFYILSIYNRALDQLEVQHNYKVKFNGVKRLLEPPTDFVSKIENDTSVVLTWIDNESLENGFIIERKANLPDSIFIVIDTINANITEYTDNYPKYNSSYIYRIKAFNNYSESDYSTQVVVNGLDTIVNNKPVNFTFKLYQNYPNPFNPTTNIRFSLQKKSHVKLRIFNTIGEVVKTISNGELLSPGNYTKVFNSGKLPSGVYFYQLLAEPIDGTRIFQQANKAILLK